MTIDVVFDWILDLRATYRSQLQVKMAASQNYSPKYRCNYSTLEVFTVFTRLSLVTASKMGDSSVSVLIAPTRSVPHRLLYNSLSASTDQLPG
jgi:hypothetical protein